MLTKEDFTEAIKQAFLKREMTASLYQAGDPRILQTLEAQATMLAMFSQQVEIAMQEPFVKARDATVLADAALKGLLFTAKPCVVQVKVRNTGSATIKLNSGRAILDSQGRNYQLLEPVTIVGGAETTLKAKQISIATQTHTVSETAPFYSVEIEPNKEGSFISSVQIKVNNEIFSHRYKFNGVSVNEKVFHIESDEFKRIFAKFGAENVLGYQPHNNDTISIEKTFTFGEIQIDLESPFSLLYIENQNEQDLKMEMNAILTAGSLPVNMATLRELARYPSVYDNNAVFLGEFDLLLRSKFQSLAFLNVWNEAKEEQVRGANAQNVNTLFVSFSLPEKSSLTKAAVEALILQTLQQADDSYRVKFIEPQIEKVRCTISAKIARMYDSTETTKQIKHTLLEVYGKNSYTVKQGKVMVKNKDVADLIEAKIPAIADIRGDFKIDVAEPVNNNPEVFRYMDENSIDVILNYENYDNNTWSG